MMEIQKKLEKADELRQKSRYREALALIRRVLRTCGKENQDEFFQCHLLAGHTYRMLGDFPKAISHYETAVEAAKASKDRTRTADALTSLSLSYRAKGDWARALKMLSQAEKIYAKLGDSEAIAFLLWSRAGTYRIKGEIPEAIKTFREAYKKFVSLKDEHAAGYCLNGLGGTSRVRGAYRDSLAYYSKANELFGRLRDPFGLAYSYCGIGNALRMTDDYEGALRSFRKALVIYRRIGDIVSSSYTLWSMSKTCMMTGERKKLAQSEKYLEEARKLFNKTDDPRGKIYCLLSEAELHFMRGNKKGALKAAQKALESAEGHAFAVEGCHSRTILALAGGEAKMPGCYKSLGLKLDFRQIPANIP
ncbi:MAG: tetratricopeptide repeat protein [Nitrospiraceae bacterium]|nr:tetratricopeptide repeat protein [Nitrospiraceae bacterium]